MKTTEKLLRESVLIILLFAALFSLFFSYSRCSSELAKHPSGNDLAEMQEMADYQRKQGRGNISVKK